MEAPADYVRQLDVAADGDARTLCAAPQWNVPTTTGHQLSLFVRSEPPTGPVRFRPASHSCRKALLRLTT